MKKQIKQAITYFEKYPLPLILTLLFSLLGGFVSNIILKEKYKQTNNQDNLNAGKFFVRFGFYIFALQLLFYIFFM
jgi:hypothetical protein